LTNNRNLGPKFLETKNAIENIVTIYGSTKISKNRNDLKFRNDLWVSTVIMSQDDKNVTHSFDEKDDNIALREQTEYRSRFELSKSRKYKRNNDDVGNYTKGKIQCKLCAIS